jgi:hypothetical protein
MAALFAPYRNVDVITAVRGPGPVAQETLAGKGLVCAYLLPL